jgi:hypothetical protein
VDHRIGHVDDVDQRRGRPIAGRMVKADRLDDVGAEVPVLGHDGTEGGVIRAPQLLLQGQRWRVLGDLPTTPLVDIVHVADAMVHALDLNALPAERVPPVQPTAWNRLALSDEACLRVFERTEAGLEELCQALGL